MKIMTDRGIEIGMPANAHCTGIAIESITLNIDDIKVLNEMSQEDLAQQINNIKNRFVR